MTPLLAFENVKMTYDVRTCHFRPISFTRIEKPSRTSNLDRYLVGLVNKISTIS